MILIYKKDFKVGSDYFTGAMPYWLPIHIVLSIILVFSILLNKTKFSNVILKTQFRRFLLFSIIIIISLLTIISCGLFLFVCFVGNCPCYRAYGVSEIECEFAHDPKSIESCQNAKFCIESKETTIFCLDENKKGKIYLRFITIFYISHLISIILLFVSYIIMKKNLSDKEIRETINNKNIIIDYFRSPQKYLFIISICGLIAGTFAQTATSIKAVHQCIDSFDINITDSAINEANFNIMLCTATIMFNTVSITFGIIQFIVLLVLFIISITCWKGNFFKKLIENATRRYVFIILGTLFYILVAFILFFIHIFSHAFMKLTNSFLYKFLCYFNLAIVIVLIASLILFYIGLSLIQINKSDIQIMGGYSEIDESIVNDNFS